MTKMHFPEISTVSHIHLTHPSLSHDRPLQNVAAIKADNFRVIHGVNRGEPLGIADMMSAGDTFQLSPRMTGENLSLDVSDPNQLRIHDCRSDVYTGCLAFFDAALTLISPTGQTLEVLTLVLTNADMEIVDTFFVPLGIIRPSVDYCLVMIDKHGALSRFAESATPAICTGTAITLEDGSECAVENLVAGQRVKTQLGGTATIRLIAQRTTRASGAYAPTLIREGSLGCHRDLIVSPEQRILIKNNDQGLGPSDQCHLARARHLINGRTVTRNEGGFVDYFQLLLDAHDIFFANGIALESCFINAHSRQAFSEHPQPLIDELMKVHVLNPLPFAELPREALARPDAVNSLRSISHESAIRSV